MQASWPIAPEGVTLKTPFSLKPRLAAENRSRRGVANEKGRDWWCSAYLLG